MPLVVTPRDMDPLGDKEIVTPQDIEELERQSRPDPKIVPGR